MTLRATPLASQTFDSFSVEEWRNDRKRENIAIYYLTIFFFYQSPCWTLKAYVITFCSRSNTVLSVQIAIVEFGKLTFNLTHTRPLCLTKCLVLHFISFQFSRPLPTNRLPVMPDLPYLAEQLKPGESVMVIRGFFGLLSDLHLTDGSPRL